VTRKRRQKPRYEVTIQVFDEDAPALEAAAAVLDVKPEDFLSAAPQFLLVFCEHMPDWSRNTFRLVRELYEQQGEPALKSMESSRDAD